jgi:hypothetical protein
VGVGATTVLGIVLTARTGEWRWLFLSLPFSLVLLVAARFAPTGYRLAPDGLHIERKGGPRVIPYRRIRGVDRESRRSVGITAFGSNGIFGRFGRFWSPTLGFYELQITDRDRIVWVATDQGWLGLSPDRADEFVERLQGRLARGA